MDEPAGLAGITVDDADDADDFGRREWRPGLGEEFESPWISDVVGGVSDGVVGVELLRRECAKRAGLICLCNGVYHCGGDWWLMTTDGVLDL